MLRRIGFGFHHRTLRRIGFGFHHRTLRRIGVGFHLERVRVVDISEQNSVFVPNSETVCSVQFLGFFRLLKSILCQRLERMLDVDRFLGGCLKIEDIPFGLAPCHGPLLDYLVPCQQA